MEWGISLKFLKNSLTGDLVKKMTVIFTFSVLFFGLFYQYMFPTYYYWQQEKPVKQAQKLIEKNQADKVSDEVVTIKGQGWSMFSEADLNERLHLSLNQAGITLSKFWLDQDTHQELLEGKTIQRLYHQKKLKNDFYARFFMKQGQLYLVGRSIPSFRETVAVLFPLLFMATISILLLLIFLLVFYVRRELILPIGKMERATRQMSALNFHVTNFETKNELGVLGESIQQMACSLQEYEQTMLTRNEQLKEFSGSIAHELKTPLAVMQLLVDAEKMGVAGATFVDELDQQLEVMNQKITQILAYSIQLKEELAYSLIDMPDYIRKQKEAHYHVDNEFIIKTSLSFTKIQSNETMLDLIFGNLITNAMKYSNDKTLLIEGQQREESYKLTFRNQAENVSPALINKLTEPFVVGEASRNTYLAGTGLGLTIVKQAVEKLGGNCIVEQNDGLFSVIITLPI